MNRPPIQQFLWSFSRQVGGKLAPSLPSPSLLQSIYKYAFFFTVQRRRNFFYETFIILKYLLKFSIWNQNILGRLFCQCKRRGHSREDILKVYFILCKGKESKGTAGRCSYGVFDCKSLRSGLFIAEQYIPHSFLMIREKKQRKIMFSVGILSSRTDPNPISKGDFKYILYEWWVPWEFISTYLGGSVG